MQQECTALASTICVKRKTNRTGKHQIYSRNFRKMIQGYDILQKHTTLVLAHISGEKDRCASPAYTINVHCVKADVIVPWSCANLLQPPKRSSCTLEDNPSPIDKKKRGAQGRNWRLLKRLSGLSYVCAQQVGLRASGPTLKSLILG